MTRRDLLKTAGAAAAVSALPLDSLAQCGLMTAASKGPAKLESEIYRVKLKHTWTTTMSSSEFRDVLMTRYIRDGVTGYGEGAPIVR